MLLNHSTQVTAATTSYPQVLQRVMAHYPSLKTAAIQIERARQETSKLNTQLSWQLQAEGGVTRNASLLGSEVDVLDASANLAKQLTSGATLGLAGSIQREDSAAVFSPALPNPTTSTSIELSYRQPLAQGAGNPLYIEGQTQAAAGVSSAQAQRASVYDELASQLIELYSATATTRARLHNLDQDIARSLRRQQYIASRLALGLAEDKDRLQVAAQISSQQAQHQGLQVQWQQQQVALNRLMGLPWDSAFEPVFSATQHLITVAQGAESSVLTLAQAHSPQLRAIAVRLQLADSAIRSRRDAREDNLDLVMFIGNRNLQGDSALGAVDESVVVGGVRLEFQHGFDKSAQDAELLQAQLDRSAALQDKRQALEDIDYAVSSLLAQIDAAERAQQTYRDSVASEQAKLDEAEQRYRSGRSDTDQLIQFESQLSTAQLSMALQQIELDRRYQSLSLLTGEVWQYIQLPEFDIYVDTARQVDAAP